MVSGIGVSDADVFVAFGAGWSMGSKSKLFRFDRQLRSPDYWLKGCGVVVSDATWLSGTASYTWRRTAPHRVLQMDRDGQILAKWGERSRTDLEGLAAAATR